MGFLKNLRKEVNELREIDRKEKAKAAKAKSKPKTAKKKSGTTDDVQIIGGMLVPKSYTDYTN